MTTGSPPAATPVSTPGARPALWTGPFVMILVAMLLGYCSNSIIAPVLPAFIIEQGGSPELVGIIVAIYSIPSVIARPPLGRLTDDWSRRGVFNLGIVGMVISCAAYLVPSVVVIAAVRVLHGTAWAAFNTGANATLADLAPTARRGEASGIFSLMPSLSAMVMPSVGLLLLSMAGAWLAFVAATLFAIAALAVAVFGPWPRHERHAPVRREGYLRSLIDRRALLPMLLEFLWMSVNVLFFTFPPLWADQQGIPLGDLVPYYPIVGIVLVIARFTVGRRLDRFPRGVPILGGIACGAAGCLVAAFADTVPVLIVAGALFAIGSSATSPMHMTIVLDRADPRTRGSSMATYSLGFQLGFGLGAAVFGFVIGAFGFPAPWFVGLLAMGGMALLVLSARGELLVRRPPASGVPV
jgi:MFS family permease